MVGISTRLSLQGLVGCSQLLFPRDYGWGLQPCGASQRAAAFVPLQLYWPALWVAA